MRAESPNKRIDRRDLICHLVSTMSERSDKPLIMVPGPVPGASGNTSAYERRTTPRFAFSADAEVFDIGSQTRVVGRSSDLGREGCYIDTISPFAVGAAVRVCLKRGLHEFEAKAIVKYTLLSIGMGLAFTDIKPEHQAVLQKWIAELSGERSPEPQVLATNPETGMAPAVGNLRQVLNELIDLMIRRRVISDKEGAGLLRKMSR
jgi:hypothetical protein